MARVTGPTKDPRMTNESCWKAHDDNLLPNPPLDTQYDPDPVLSEKMERPTDVVKIIMAHELRENLEGFKSMAEQVAKSYNQQHELIVGEELPLGLKEKDNG